MEIGMKALRTVVLAVMVIGELGSDASAEDVSWLAPVNGNWSDGTKWDVGHAPVAGDRVFITVPGMYTVTLNTAPATLQAMHIGSSGPDGITLSLAGRTLTSSGVVAVNPGGMVAGNGSVNVGATGLLRLNGGTLQLNGNIEVSGAVEYAGGSITGPGRFQISSGSLALIAPLQNSVTLYIYDSSVSGMTLTNSGTLLGAFVARFLCPVVNATDGLLSVETGNGASDYRFENVEGLVNMGTITAGSSGNGSNTITVPNGPFTNQGMFNTRDSRGGPIVVTAELINEPGATFENTPGVGARLLLGRAGAHHVNRGTFRGVESVTQSGVDPSFRQVAGLIDLAGSLTINGGTFEYVGGSITGGTLSVNGVQVMLTNPFTNTATFNVANGSVVSGLTLTNNATLSDFSNAAGPRFLCPVNNGPTGLISVQTGNGGSDYRFEHATGLVNMGTITAGSSDNGSNTITVPNGPFTNQGMFKTRDSRGGPIVVTAELINEAGATFENTPGVGARLLLGKASAHHVNRGTFRGVESVTQSGAAPSFRQEAGMIDLTGNLTIVGGTFEYVGGSITGGGTLTMGGAQMILTNPYENTVSLNVTNDSVVSGMMLTNRNTLFDGSNAANPRFLCPVVNGITGFISIRTGNGGSDYRFEHATGLVNEGLVTIGSSDNGVNTLTVLNGPFTNRGTVNTRNSRGAQQAIVAELANEAGGVIMTTPGVGAPLRIEKPGARHVNRGQIECNDGIEIRVSGGGGQFTNDTMGSIRTLGAGAQLSFSGDAALASSPWVTNNGTMETVGASSAIVVNVPGNRQFLNDTGNGQMHVRAGSMHVSNGNGGRWRNGGLIRIYPDGSVFNTGMIADNFDTATQTWTGGRMIIEGPGTLCFPMANGSIRVLETAIGCIHEAVTCTSGGATNLFGGVREIGAAGEFTLDNMTMTMPTDFVNNGTVMFINGAVVNAPGTFHSNGRTVIHNSTFIPTSVVIGNGELVGAGQVQGHIVNNGGRARPGQSPGRLETTQSYTQGAGGTLEIELGGHAQGTEYDVLVAGMAANLGGTLEVLLINSFVPSPGDQFIVVQAASVVGEFDTEVLPAGLYVDYRSTEVRVFSPCPGDWNHSNLTSVQDIFDFLASYFAGEGDFNHSGATSVQDIFDFLAAYFSTCP
jgi:hypothetical protein